MEPRLLGGKTKTVKMHVASRNHELALSRDSVHYKLMRDYNLNEILQPNETLKGEIVGDGIQKNPLKIKGKNYLT